MNLLAGLAGSEAKVQAVYGDRGKPQQALRELGWHEDYFARIPVTLIPNACHFPMLENPASVAQVINRL